MSGPIPIPDLNLTDQSVTNPVSGNSPVTATNTTGEFTVSGSGNWKQKLGYAVLFVGMVAAIYYLNHKKQV